MVESALERWLAYRDDVARACGIARWSAGPRWCTRVRCLPSWI